MKISFHAFLLMVTLLTACTSINSPATTPTHVLQSTTIPGGLEGVTPTTVSRGPEILGVFEGVTPCSAKSRPLPQVLADTDCEQMIWSIVFHQDPQTGSPTTYSLKSAYGLSKLNTNDLVDGGTSISMEGTWTITKGTKSDPDATVYQINPDDPATTVSFLRVNENLIHVLSGEKTMLVGNGAWSYTLNRMDNQPPAQVEAGSPPEPAKRPPAPPMPEGSSVFGVFDGRTPCHELVMEFTQNEPFPGCLKVKWRLTLYQDSATSAPSSYLFMSTSQYREGSWTIVSGMEADPDAVVYQLQMRESQYPVSFLRVDENHLFLLDQDMNLLVGNPLFSYTLSRVEPEVQ